MGLRGEFPKPKTHYFFNNAIIATTSAPSAITFAMMPIKNSGFLYQGFVASFAIFVVASQYLSFIPIYFFIDFLLLGCVFYTTSDSFWRLFCHPYSTPLHGQHPYHLNSRFSLYWHHDQEHKADSSILFSFQL